MTTDQNSPTNWALCTPKFTQQDAKSWHSKCALWFLNRLGWTLRYGGLPAARGVMIVYPHTSNWDYLYGMLGRWALGIPLRYLVKEKLFTGVSGFFLGRWVRYWGGEPIERGKASGSIAKIAERMHQADWFWLAITPEGTRSYSPYFRSGFYHIVQTAKVPLVIAFIDYGKQELGLHSTIELTGDKEADLAQMRKIYAQFEGKYPAQKGAIVFRAD